MSEILYNKYRPKQFDDVIGNTDSTSQLRKVLDKKRAQVFLFNGPSGCGKTTLARIAADYVGCSPRDIVEIDAATFNGIDKMREVTNMMGYKPIGGGDARAVIIDESHALSRQAWDSLLKATEEPRAGVYWMFCTTNPGKVPDTIKTRCTSIKVTPLNDMQLEKLVKRVAKSEGIKISEGVRQVIVREARGSARQALVNLALCDGAETAKQAAGMLHSAVESDPTIELCRFIVKGGSWSRCMGIINKFEGESAEGVRIVVCNYLASVLKNTKSDDSACDLLTKLEAFSTPYNVSEGFAPLLLSIGQALYNGE